MSDTCISYRDAEDIVTEVQKQFKSGDKMVFVTIPGANKFLKCVDARAILRDVIQTRCANIWLFFSFSFAQADEPFIFVFIKRPAF